MSLLQARYSVMENEGEKALVAQGSTQVIPVLPLRDVVVYPHMVIPLFVGREKSIHALEAAMAGEKKILLVAQRSAAVDDPQGDDIYEIGTVSSILQLLKLPDGTIKVLVEGTDRARIGRLQETDQYFTAEVVLVAPMPAEEREAEVLMRAILGQFDQYVKLNNKVPPEILSSLAGSRSRPSRRHYRRASVAQDRREARHPRDRQHSRAAREADGHPRIRDRFAAGGKAHPRPRQAPDGEEPAGVLP